MSTIPAPTGDTPNGPPTPDTPVPKVITIDAAPVSAPPPAEEAHRAELVPTAAAPATPPAPSAILAVDIGGTKVKVLASGQTEPRKAPTGRDFTPARLVETIRELADGWDYEAISIGCPALVGPHGPRSEPGNLGPGWVGFDFAAAFGKPLKMVNDAAMQALGSYDGGRMLFLGLGTGVGSCLIAGHVIVPLELGSLPYGREGKLGDVLGKRGLRRLGKPGWRKHVNRVVAALMASFVVDYVVVGGGNAKHARELPAGVRLGHNLTAFRGGFRLWSLEDAWVMAAAGGDTPELTMREALRLV